MIWFWIAIAGWIVALGLFIERCTLQKLLRESEKNFETAMNGWRDLGKAYKELAMRRITRVEAQRDRETL